MRGSQAVKRIHDWRIRVATKKLVKRLNTFVSTGLRQLPLA
jgi:hypothetical protein